MDRIRYYKKIIAMVAVMFLFSAVITYAEEDIEAEEVLLRDIDFDVASEMYVDTSQIIEVTPIPAGVAINSISFISSNTSVVTVNEVGRIRAVGTGRATIYVTADGITRSSVVTVKSSKIYMTDLDVGPYEKKLEAGQSLLLQVTPIPVNATEGDIRFYSSDSKIATVNQAGRVTGVAPGEVKITVSGGGITKTVDITVIEEKVVTEIDVIDFQKKMKVKEKQNLSIVLYPEDAREKDVKFVSSDPYIATVSSSGQIAALHKGKTVIAISCGKAKTELELTVREITKGIDVNSTYVALKPGEKFRLSAIPYPNSANRNVTYKPTNSNVIAVDEEGVITAKKIGNSSVIISNEDMYQMVFVVVNKNSGVGQITGGTSDGAGGNKKNAEKEDFLEKGIRSKENDEIVIPGEGFDVIEKDFLLYLKKNHCRIKIDYPDYILEIDSANINNPNHSFATQISISNDGNHLLLNVNDSKELPGKMKVYLKNSLCDMRYLFFQNERTGQYEKIALDIKEHSFNIDDGGVYVLTNEKLNSFKIDRKIVILISVAFLVVFTLYVTVRKKYWFW